MGVAGVRRENRPTGPENRVTHGRPGGGGVPRETERLKHSPVFAFCPCLGIIFAIISNPVMNISMQRTFCFFQIISLETEFLEQELLVKGGGIFSVLLHFT